MASASINSFSLTLLTGNRVRVDVQFNVNLTATESRLRIPSHVWVRLMERDGARDLTEMYASWSTTQIPRGDFDDDALGGWLYAGQFATTTTGNFSRVLNRSSLPGESGSEEWYAIVATRPDLISDVAHSAEIVANIA